MQQDARREKLEALIHARVEDAVGRWEGVAPAHMLAKMREAAENFWRTQPDAVRILNLLVEKAVREASGLGVSGNDAAARAKKGAGKP